MIVPGSRGWIAKYFQLAENGIVAVSWSVPPRTSADRYAHNLLLRSGIVFGFPEESLFAPNLDRSKWTTDEQLKVCLFEALLFVWIRNNKHHPLDSKKFLAALDNFYKKHRYTSLAGILGYLLRETPAERLERVLSKRTEVPRNLTKTKSWFTYINNVFVYLDVILFDEYLRNKQEPRYDYQQLALLALAVISMSASSDGIIEEKEKQLFEFFLLSADLDPDEHEVAKMRFNQGISLEELSESLVDPWSLKRYLLDISALTIFSNHDAVDTEREFLQQLGSWLGLKPKDYNESLICAQQFVINHQSDAFFLRDNNAVEQMVDSVSKRWIKILGRNKDRLATELKQSAELVSLIRKSAKEELSKEEKEKVKSQFLDIIKTMPSLAIFLLPGGAILLPIVLRIIPALVPSAFRDNEIDN